MKDLLPLPELPISSALGDDPLPVRVLIRESEGNLDRTPRTPVSLGSFLRSLIAVQAGAFADLVHRATP